MTEQMECQEIKQKIIILILLIALFATSAGAIIYSNHYWETHDIVPEKLMDFGKVECYEITIPEYKDYYEELKMYQSIFVKGKVVSQNDKYMEVLSIADSSADSNHVDVYIIDESVKYEIGDDVYLYADIDSYDYDEGGHYYLRTGSSGSFSIVSPDGYIEKEPVGDDEYMSVEECIARGDDIFKKISFKLSGTIRTRDVQNNREYYIYDADGNELEIFPAEDESFEDGEQVTIIGKLAKGNDSLVIVRHAD